MKTNSDSTGGSWEQDTLDLDLFCPTDLLPMWNISLK